MSILQFDGFWSVGAALQFFFMTFAGFNNADIAFAGETLVADEFSIHLEMVVNDREKNVEFKYKHMC